MILFFLALTLLVVYGDFKKTNIKLPSSKNISIVILVIGCMFSVKAIHPNNANKKRFNIYYANLEKEIIIEKTPSEKATTYKEKVKQLLLNFEKRTNYSNKLKGSLSKTKYINSKILNKKLPYRVYLPPTEFITKKLPVIYINDGNRYINGGKLPYLLDSLIIAKKIEPIAAVFLEPKDVNNKKIKIRQELFLCNPLFVDFFVKEFMPYIEKTNPISFYKEDRSILGLSFGGLAAAYIANQATNSFKNVIMQSPAFNPCPDIYKAYKKKPKKDLNIYLSYGTGRDTQSQDLPMIRILKRRKYNLKVERIKGGNHNWETWRPQLKNILIHFFSKNENNFAHE